MEAMSSFIPKSSFHAIYSVFYKKEYNSHAKYISSCLAGMFSTITIRLLSAKKKNPPLFKHVTLHLDGHDTRATYQGVTTAEMYSYKLKKPGLRTQVVMDSVDGGYTQYLKKLTEESDTHTLHNFAHPYRKKKHQELTKEESAYNATFGSFRSQMEGLFGDLGTTFERHNNRSPVLVEKKETYNLQLKLALLLLNIKKMVALLNIPTEPIHSAWLRDGFDYPTNRNDAEQPMEYFPLGTLLEDANEMERLQAEFLELELGDEDTQMESAQRRSSNFVIEIPIRTPKRKMPVEETGSGEEVEDDDL
ncbi:hypothetical protein BGZ47_002160 [Haplosporangium gracile]|nr:hypothetical protein BGZ47_002160 [Haplosporangium gracile]